jgi:hypothetical protein
VIIEIVAKRTKNKVKSEGGDDEWNVICATVDSLRPSSAAMAANSVSLRLECLSVVKRTLKSGSLRWF